MLNARAKELKRWLEAYMYEEERIEAQTERLCRLRSRMGVQATAISDLPKSHGRPNVIETNTIALTELQESLSARTREHEQLRQIIEGMLKDLRADEQCIVQMRYIDGFEWKIIIDAIAHIKGKEVDDSFQRTVYRIHDTAIEKMAKIW